MTYNTDRLMSEITLPGLVRPAVKSSYEMMCVARELYGEIGKQDRLNVNRWVELGKALILLKDACVQEGEHGAWTKALENAKIPKQKASEATRIAKLPTAAITLCHTVNDLMRAIGPEDNGHDESGTSPPGRTGQAESTISPSSHIAKAKKRTSNVSRKRKEREPGEDDDVIGNELGQEVVKAKEEVFDLLGKAVVRHEVSKPEESALRRDFDSAFNRLLSYAGVDT